MEHAPTYEELSNRVEELESERGQILEQARTYERIVRVSHFPISLVDRDYRYRLVNDAYQEFFGIVRKDIVGLTVENLLGMEVFERDIKPHLDRALAGEEVQYEASFFYPGIGNKYVIMAYYPYSGTGGRIEGVVAVTRDITDRKAAEQALQDARDQLELRVRERTEALVETNAQLRREIEVRKSAEEVARASEMKFAKIFQVSPDWIAITTRSEGLYLDVNETFLNYSGYIRSEFVGRTISELAIWESSDQREKSMAMLARDGQLRNFEAWFRTKSGQRRNMLCSAELIDFGGENCILSVCRDITERKRAELELARSKKQLGIYADHLQSLLEQERKELAREIHDELGQILTALKMQLAMVVKKAPPEMEQFHTGLAGAIELIDETIRSVQKICKELRPEVLNELGLVDAMQWQAYEFQKRSGIECTTDFEGLSPKEAQDRKIERALFRIYQEALTNIARHAQATKAQAVVRLKAGRIELVVQDNGIGISRKSLRDPTSYGIIGIRERANLLGGKATISGRKDRGTAIRVAIPLPAGKRPGPRLST